MPQDPYPPCTPPDPDTRPPRWKLPPRACDAHAHVFGPEAKYPLSPRRGYTPPEASLEDYFRLHAILGIERGVLVQASAYGTDNACLLDALAAGGARLRGVAAVGPEAGDAELARLHAAGVRGLRVNMADPGGNPFASMGEVRRMGERIREMGWHIEFLAHVNQIPEPRKTFGALPVEAVFGHLGYVPAAEGAGHPGFQDFLGLVREGRTWVKLTAPNRLSALGRPPYTDTDPFARALIEAAPERMLWGSDWPHVFFSGFMPNDADLLDQAAGWAPDEEVRRRIFVENPARLYGFE